MLRLLALSLVVTGLVVIFFPHIQQLVYTQEEEKLVAQFYESNQSNHEIQRDELNILENFNQEDVVEKPKRNEGDMLGLIHINKIDLTLPMLYGATEDNLNVGAGVVTGTSPIGEKGNTGIAAHRSYVYGQLFNRLKELEIGDQVVIETKDKKIKYEVFKDFLVLPEEVGVLDPIGEESIITLITCEPMYNPTHRIIVQAKKVSEEDAS